MSLPDCLSIDDILEAVENDNNVGFCRVCGTEHYNVEPDARRYGCEECGRHEVSVPKNC